MSNARRTEKRKPSLALTAAACAVFVAGMVGMSFAAVPLYRLFCQVTGYGGTTQQASTAPAATLDRVVKVRFDANIGNGLGWSFRPVEREVRIKVGAVAEAKFVAENRERVPTTATAAFNVTPLEAGAYFTKISCFCFSEQTLAAGEKVEFPVVFFVDPAIAKDRDLDVVDTITLSYTFYPADPAPPTRPVAAAEADRAGDPL
jgi:cytochrome c oxidase assembly protein subunit 11